MTYPHGMKVATHPAVLPAEDGLMPNWLRWILFLPAAVLAFMAANAIIAIAHSMSGGGLNVLAVKPVAEIVQAVLGPWAFVMAGAMTAPRRQTLVAGILLLVVVLATGMALSLTLLVSTDKSDPIWFVAMFVGIASAIYAVRQVYQEERQRSWP